MKIKQFFEQLNQEEQKQLAKLEQFLKTRLSYPSSVAKKIEQWDWLVNEVKNGYHDYIYEYLNDIDGRHVLEDILDRAEEPIRAKLLDLIQQIDKNFLEATEAIHESLITSEFALSNPKKYFWYYRVPKIITEQLSTDLDKNGKK